MKKIITPKISTTALVFVLGLVVAIFAFQVSKIYASKLSNSLQVDGGTVITGSLSSGAPVRVGTSNEAHALNVGGGGTFLGLVQAESGIFGNPYHKSFFMTAGAVDEAVNAAVRARDKKIR